METSSEGDAKRASVEGQEVLIAPCGIGHNSGRIVKGGDRDERRLLLMQLPAQRAPENVPERAQWSPDSLRAFKLKNHHSSVTSEIVFTGLSMAPPRESPPPALEKREPGILHPSMTSLVTFL